MHSGLPSLLDAIFGKKDLVSVSVNELEEVLSEFPSFNAAHFFLSKKLKDENNASFEKESRRTALYFNNAFWLQSILDGSDYVAKETIAQDRETIPEEPLFVSGITETDPYPDLHEMHEGEKQAEAREELPDRVSSFDDLLSKYKIEETESVHLYQQEPEGFAGNENSSADIPDMAGIFHQKNGRSAEEESVTEPQPETEQTPVEQPITGKVNAVTLNAPGNPGFEIHEEIVNEYGIFEEVLVKKHDFDLDAFDPPEETNTVQDDSPVDIPPSPDHVMENRTIVVPALTDETENSSDEDDYDAFDRPIDDSASEEADDTELRENSENQNVNGEEMPKLSGRLEELQKAAMVFDPHKAESIVFAPYHMIDYFASQGIKLVLEENPADSFGKQLKSFTDWLKVMKKLPLKTETGRSEQQETDRIRHFAEHSVEERDILTESMAEVLAKQGMFENAIALYQKLSLIYPPKSAYFASRIEQLKASQP